MTVDEIKIKEESLKKELYALRSEAEAGRIEKPHKMKLVRNIAEIVLFMGL
jgi:ribosomal protein L29